MAEHPAHPGAVLGENDSTSVVLCEMTVPADLKVRPLIH
jgi:hypothetical protein